METVRSSPKDLPQDIQTALQEHGAVLRLSHMEIVSGIKRLLRQGIPKEVISQVVTQVVEAVSKDSSPLTCQDFYSRIETQPEAFTTEEASLHEPPHTTRPPALAAFAVQEPALTAENSPVTNVQECAEISASGENLNVFVSLKEVISRVVTQVVEAVSKDSSPLTCQDFYSRIETQPEAFTTEEASLREPPHTTRPPALTAFAVEEPALTAENSSVTNVQECAEISASEENLNVSVSLHDLIPALPGPAAKGNQMSPSEKRSLTLDAVNQLPRCPQWPRAPFAALRGIRQSTFLVQVLLRRWVFEIKRDWIAMINAIALRETRKSLFGWPRQPIHSDFWRQTKVSLFKARRDVHQ